ncbi:MAG: saccharopine dehydrogenase C-terminal domain-containing protein [Planctomycetota bacterium]|nr:saccharopine dehydrogenase C-terminal domain-containing protein [Planctomycetota bacterium]
MKKVLVLGAGKVGKSVGELLLMCGEGNYHVTLADREQAPLEEATANLARLRASVRHQVAFDARRLDVSDDAQVRSALTGHDYVVCMLPFNFVQGIAEAANDLGVHYFDVTEDVATTEQVRQIDASGRAKVALVPQCGLAPGYIAVAAYDVARQFERVHDLTLRVGALPQYPTNQLKYNVTWSAAGVINEYCEPCNVMLNGHAVKVPALEGLERFSFEGVEYEAFYTSGGVGSLIETLQNEKRLSPGANVAYKTIRYPGHRDLMRCLLHDLGLSVEHAEPNARGQKFDRWLLIDLFDHSLARTLQDVVVIFVNAVGEKDGRLWQVNFERTVRATSLFGRVWPAIELTTAAGVCGFLDLHRRGKLPRATGFVRQEEVSLAEFSATPFGLGYDAPERLEQAVLGNH